MKNKAKNFFPEVYVLLLLPIKKLAEAADEAADRDSRRDCVRRAHAGQGPEGLPLGMWVCALLRQSCSGERVFVCFV